MTMTRPVNQDRRGTGAPSRTTRRPGGTRRRRLRGAVGVLVALALWTLVTGTGMVSPSDLPSVPAVAEAFARTWPEQLASLGSTLASMFVGLVIASAFGVVLGVLVGMSRWADAATDVLVRMMRPLPSLAFIPIAILLAGLGVEMTAGLVAFAAFWPVFINTRYATHSVDPRYLDTARALGMGRWERVWRVLLPCVAPNAATGVRIAAGLAIVVTISVELVAGTGGLGGFVLTAEQGGASAVLYSGLVLGGVVGWLLNLALLALTRRLLPWQVSAR